IDTGKKFKLGVYDVNSSGEPNDRLLEGSEQSLDSTGDKEESISLDLDAGLYFLAVRSDSSSATLLTQTRGLLGRILGADTLSAAGRLYYYSDSGTYAADGLPTTFPASPTVASGTSMFRPMLKTSATP
ncbi:MAG: hypothetical protein ACYSUI_23900, partial [Planctomycetota bacterium]